MNIKFYERFKFSCVHSSHDLCAREQAHSLEQGFPTCGPRSLEKWPSIPQDF